MESGGSIFNAMLQEFDGGAAHSSTASGRSDPRQAANHRVLPDQMDNGEIESSPATA
jgi:hypothetical protein